MTRPARRPTPGWVTPVPIPERAPQAADGREVLLVDRQVRVGPQGVTRFVRGALRPTSIDGLGPASTIRVQYDASYQALAWHVLRIHRGTAELDALRAAYMRVANADDDPSEELVHGLTSATVILRDVRVGDVIEYAYSVSGDQPALHDRYSDSFSFVRDAPVGNWEQRLYWPTSRKLALRAHEAELEPSIERRGDYDVYTWRLPNAPAWQDDDFSPSWYLGAPWVEVSELESWRDVAAWAAAIYESRATPNTRVRALAQQWQRELGTAGAIERAIRFTQDEVRYMGFELGVGSLVPNPPDLVSARRFGDCKDKTLLLLTFLRALGVQASAALVNTSDLEHVRERLPAPGVFDHVLVRASIDGATRWIDGTRSYERGALKDRIAPDFGVALVVANDTSDLEDMPHEGPRGPTQLVRESFVLHDGGSARLQVTTRYQHDHARDTRSRIASGPAEDLQRLYTSFYEKEYGHTKPQAPLGVRDDEASDSLEIEEAYTLTEPWEGDTFELRPWSMDDILPRPDSTRPELPLALERGEWLRHEIRAELPESFTITPGRIDLVTPWFEYHYQARYRERVLDLSYEYRGLASEVPAADVPRYLKQARKAHATLGFVLTRDTDARARNGVRFVHDDELPSKAEMTATDWVWVALVLLLVLLGASAGVILVWRRGREALRKRRFFSGSRKGETAADPVRVRSLAEVARHMSGARCECAGGPVMPVVREPGRVRYMGQEVWHQTVACDACAFKLTRYFRVRDS